MYMVVLDRNGGWKADDPSSDTIFYRNVSITHEINVKVGQNFMYDFTFMQHLANEQHVKL